MNAVGIQLNDFLRLHGKRQKTTSRNLDLFILFAGSFYFIIVYYRTHLNSNGANSCRLRRHVRNSWAVFSDT
jgi:hypothetical protein